MTAKLKEVRKKLTPIDDASQNKDKNTNPSKSRRIDEIITETARKSNRKKQKKIKKKLDKLQYQWYNNARLKKGAIQNGK